MLWANDVTMICSLTTTDIDLATDLPSSELVADANLPVPPTRKKVLIADDSLVCVTALSMKLRSEGYDVVACQQGARIVSTARCERPDLILLDINFPPDQARGVEEWWDGLLVLEWLRRLDETKLTPVIILTGEDPERYRTRSFAAGAVGFMEKPVRPIALLAAIRHALKEECGEDEGGMSNESPS